VLEFLRVTNIAPDELMRRLNQTAESTSEEGCVTEGPPPPELAAALDHLDADHYEDALVAAAPYVASDQSGLRTDANRLCALACSRLGRWGEAVAYWRTLLNDEPTAHNTLQHATSVVMDGDLVTGKILIDKARSMNETSGEMPDLLMLTNFVTALTEAGEVAAAMPYLDDIRQAYVDVGVTDPTLLYVRGMPSLNVFLNKSWPIVCAALNQTQWLGWYTAMLPHLDGRGNTELNEWLANRRYAV
jgi:hypothetical protein